MGPGKKRFGFGQGLGATSARVASGPPPDVDPAAFDFIDNDEADVSTVISSDIVQITDIDAAATVTISGDGTPQYRICDDGACSTVDHDWSSASGAIEADQYIQLRLTSSDDAEVTRTATVVVGDGSADWAVTTAAAAEFLDEVLASTVFELDATKASSYTSGQTWANLTAVPADGAAQSAYNFTLGDTSGSNTSDPTFTGSAGDPAAYFLLDGGDYFDLDTLTTFINSLHKNEGSDFWIAIAFRFQDISPTFQSVFASTQGSSVHGIRLIINGDKQLRCDQYGGSLVTVTHTAVTLVDDTDYLMVVSHDHGTDKTKFWINTTTGTELGHAFADSSTDSTAPTVIGAAQHHFTIIAADTRFYTVAAGNEYLDDTKAGEIFDLLRARHSRGYGA